MSNATTKREPFPAQGLLPKTQTQALQFVEQHPQYDGRNVIVAILDTGVDPGAAGLELTSDGRPKVIDVQDPTGSGDIDTSTIIKSADKSDAGGLSITGLSGRKLQLGTSAGWTNPSGEWRVGVQQAYNFFPSGLKRRMKKTRRDQWDLEQTSKTAEAIRALDAFSRLNTGSSLSAELFLERSELQARVDALAKAAKDYSDCGITFDCVVFKHADGSWRAVVDTKGDGDLTLCTPMTNFAAERQFERWDDVTLLNYCVNIYEDGDVCSVVVDSGAHGTHVASIVAGNFPEDPDLCGVAPGAQIVSYKIGDGRMDGMETGTGMIRALNMCVAAGVDVINMSFGEPTKIPGGGRVSQLMSELVCKHGIIFVSSAGNAGPALSTVGAPGSTTFGLIGVGAHVNPAMMLAEYSMHNAITPAPINYTWSSRGPAYDGQLGVSVSAPGGAIASVPRWTLQRKQLMNGTSMSSPNVAGCVALLVSGLKSMDVWYTPHRIRRALEASAMAVAGVEPHSLGHGLIQVSAAFEIAKHNTISRKSHNNNNMALAMRSWILDLPFKVSIPSCPSVSGSGCASGIYLREPAQTLVASEHDVKVEVLFETDSDDTCVSGDGTMRFNKEDRNAIELQIELVSTAPWLTAPQHLLLGAHGRGFKVWVDPSTVPVSEPAFAEVLGYDTASPRSVGPLFRVPVTVIKPLSCATESASETLPASSVARLRYDPKLVFDAVPFSPGSIVRKFLAVPPGATTAIVRLVPAWQIKNGDSDGNENGNEDDDVEIPTPSPDSDSAADASDNVFDRASNSRQFFLHCLQMHEHSDYKQDELKTFVRVQQAANGEIVREMKVTGGRTLEVCVAQYWSSLGNGNMDIHVTFQGVSVSSSSLTLAPINGLLSKINMVAELCPIRIDPSGSLTHYAKSVSPDGELTRLVCSPPIEARDLILGNKPRPTFSLMLSYTVEQAEAGKATFCAPLLNDLLYDSPLDAQLTMVFNQDKELIATGDAWPGPITVPAGKLTVRVCIRHEDASMLEPLKQMTLVVERKLSSSVPLSVSKTAAGPVLSKDKDKFYPRILAFGQSAVAFVSVPHWATLTTLPKDLQPGDTLSGKFTPSGKTSKVKVSVHLVVPPKAADAPKDPTVKLDEDDKKVSAQDKWTVELIKAKIGLLEKLKAPQPTSSSSSSPAAGAAAVAAGEKVEEAKKKEEEEENTDELFDSELAEAIKLLKALPAIALDSSPSLAVDVDGARFARLCLQYRTCKKDTEKDSDKSKLSTGYEVSLLAECKRLMSKADEDRLWDVLADATARAAATNAVDKLGVPAPVKDTNKALEARKKLVVDAISVFAYIQVSRLVGGVDEKSDVKTVKALDETAQVALQELALRGDVKGKDFAYLSAKRHAALGRPGVALTKLEVFGDGSSSAKSNKNGKLVLTRVLSSAQVDVSASAIHALRTALCEKLGWEHVRVLRDELAFKRFPKAFPLF